MKVKVYKHSNLLFEAEFSHEDLIDGTEIFIGREQDCHLVLDDPQVSRHHAVITISKDSITLKKLSKFGELLLNGNAVGDAKLEKNSQVLIGEHLLEFSELDSLSLESSTLFKEESSEEKRLGDETLGEFNSTELLDKSESESDAENEIEELNSDDPDDTDDPDDSDDVLTNESESESEEFNNDFETDSDNVHNDESDFSEDGFSENDSDGFGSDDDGFGGNHDGFGSDDGGFGDDGGGFGDDSSESTQVFQSFASYSLKIFGEFAPFDTFKIEDSEIFIGRDTEKCQIILNDPEVSSVHAKIKKSLINCVLEDLNSSNGTILNGDRINKSELTNGDEFVIGETSFTVQISSDLLEAEKDTLMPVQENQEVEVVEEVEEEVDFDEFSADSDGLGPEEEEPKSLVKKIMKDPKKKRMAMIIGALLFVLMLFDDDSDSPKPKEGKQKKVAKEGEIKNKKTLAKDAKKKLSPQVIEKLEQNYALALAKYEEAKYSDAKVYLDTVRSIDPDYKDTQTLLKLVKQGYEELTRLKKEEQEEKERQKRVLEIKKLVEKARDAVEKREVQISRNYFAQILEKDPENIDVPQLKMIIDAHVKEIEEKKMAEEQARIRRQNMVDALKPAKTLFLRGDWYEAIGKLEKYTKKQGIDEDLVKEATSMLKESRQKLSSVVNPLLGRARSFKEGQDLKRAYETFGEVLKHQPTNEEALNERQDIKESLDTRSRKIYREALISESLSLFSEAKEKFQEVQQVSPVGSEYYVKATNKLKEYLE